MSIYKRLSIQNFFFQFCYRHIYNGTSFELLTRLWWIYLHNYLEMKLYVSNLTILVLACHLWSGVYFKIKVKRYLIRIKTLISTESKLISGNETNIDCSKHLRKVRFYIATSKTNVVEKHESIDVLAKVFCLQVLNWTLTTALLKTTNDVAIN